MTQVEFEAQLATGYVLLNKATTVRISSPITIPQGCTIEGRSGISSVDTGNDSLIELTGTGSLILKSNVSINGVTFRRVGAYTTPSGLFFSGSAICLANEIVNDIEINSCNFYGFFIGLDFSAVPNKGRIHTSNCNFDCTTAIKLNNVLDTCYFSDIHMYPFLGNAVINGQIAARRSALFQLSGAVDWLQVTNCFSHSAESFIKGQGLTGSILGGGYDFESYNSGIGTAIEIYNNDRAGDVSIVGTHFNGGHCHIRVNQTAIDHSKRVFNLTGCNFKDAGWGFVDLINGNGSISGCTFAQVNAELDWIGQIQNASNVVSTANIYSTTRLGKWANLGTGQVLEGQCLVV